MRIVSTFYEVVSPKIKDNYKIVHFSDIHYEKGYNLKRLEKLLKKTKEIKPDFICITGDLIDTPNSLNDLHDYNVFRKFLKDLGSICKVIISIGNHEFEMPEFNLKKYKEVISKFENIENVIVLDNDMYKTSNISFTGCNPTYSYYKTEEKDSSLLINDFNEKNFSFDDNYQILLIHTPKDLLKDKIYLKTNLSEVDLILSGHTHGGMVPLFIPGHFGFIAPSKKLFPSCVRGKLVRDKTTLIICSGIVRLSNVSGLHQFNDTYAMHVNIISLRKQ